MKVFLSLFTIALNAILAENFILVKFMGICPFMGVSKRSDTALGMGLAVTFVMGLASAATWAVNEFLLVPLNLAYMQTLVFILVIAALVQLVEMFLQKSVPSLYQALGIYLPLITTNCAVLGVALLNIQKSYNFIESLFYGVTGGIGFTVAILLFSSVRERLEDCDCPKAFKGFPIALIAAGQPQPLSYLSVEENSGSPVTMSTYMPISNSSQYSPVNARSVPLSCVTRYCSSVSLSRMACAAGFL